VKKVSLDSMRLLPPSLCESACSRLMRCFGPLSMETAAAMLAVRTSRSRTAIK
jgi:hypothetical protein